jgi:hypothetical protein
VEPVVLGDPRPGACRTTVRCEPVPSFEIPPDSEARAEDLVPNRWKYRFPVGAAEDSDIDAVYNNPRLLDPFNKSKLKGDMPVFGKHGFLILAGSSDTLIDARRVPTTNAVSTADPDSFEFFGDGKQAFIRQSVRLSIELFRGSAGFKPVDFSLKITPEFNINYLRA